MSFALQRNCVVTARCNAPAASTSLPGSRVLPRQTWLVGNLPSVCHDLGYSRQGRLEVANRGARISAAAAAASDNQVADRPRVQRAEDRQQTQWAAQDEGPEPPQPGGPKGHAAWEEVTKRVCAQAAAGSVFSRFERYNPLCYELGTLPLNACMLPVSRRILHLAVPIFATYAIGHVAYMVDTAFVGHLDNPVLLSGLVLGCSLANVTGGVDGRTSAYESCYPVVKGLEATAAVP